MDVSLENILAMQDMSSRLGGASFYLELPNQCDTRNERGVMSLNLTHFDLCYVAAPKYILEFSPTTSSELVLAEAGLLEGSYFGGVGVADGSGPEFHTRTLNNLNQTPWHARLDDGHGHSRTPGKADRTTGTRGDIRQVANSRRE